MGYVLLGILAGIGLPVQTSVNNRLKPRVGGPERTSLISFFVGSVFLLLWVLATEGTARLPVDRTAGYPFWIWTGGAFGVCFLLGNLFLISRVGSANTVIYPVVGQIIMGLLVDHFGWFMSDVQKLTILRAMGGALVLVGMLVITGTGKEAGTESRPGSWQAPVIGIGIGALSAAQTAINARLGTALDNPIQAALVSFSVGTVLLLMICLFPGVRKQPAGRNTFRYGRGWAAFWERSSFSLISLLRGALEPGSPWSLRLPEPWPEVLLSISSAGWELRSAGSRHGKAWDFC